MRTNKSRASERGLKITLTFTGHDKDIIDAAVMHASFGANEATIKNLVVMAARGHLRRWLDQPRQGVKGNVVPERVQAEAKRAVLASSRRKERDRKAVAKVIGTMTNADAEKRFKANGKLRAAVNKSYQEGKRTREERDRAHAVIDARDAAIKDALRANGSADWRASERADWLSDDNVARIKE